MYRRTQIILILWQTHALIPSAQPLGQCEQNKATTLVQLSGVLQIVTSIINWHSILFCLSSLEN